jgi:hypothetical protein
MITLEKIVVLIDADNTQLKKLELVLQMFQRTEELL